MLVMRTGEGRCVGGDGDFLCGSHRNCCKLCGKVVANVVRYLLTPSTRCGVSEMRKFAVAWVV